MSALLLKSLSRYLKAILQPLTYLVRASQMCLRVRMAQTRYRRLEAVISKKEKKTICFQMVHVSIWKADRLYHLLNDSKDFEPLIIICPHFPASEQERELEFKRCENLCRSKKYAYVSTRKGDRYLTLADALGPVKVDVVFLQNSWERTLPQYRLESWGHSLPCYIPYFFTMNVLDKGNYGKLFHASLWAYFLESEWHLEKAKQNKIRCASSSNLFATGYPGLDRFTSPIQSDSDPWKNAFDKNKIRVIYAPHHTISSADAGLAYSTFEKLGVPMLELAKAFGKNFQFAFKPHPLLFDKLCDDGDWGYERAMRYWESWRELENGQVEEGDYTELFNNSSALIHDCNSFLAEYIATGKPALFLSTSSESHEKINEFGRCLLDAHYQASDKEGITKFLQEVLLDGNDTLCVRRSALVHDKLVFDDSSSQAIFSFLEERLVGNH